MQSYSTEYLQQIINPITFETQNGGNNYLLVIAASYAFKLSSEDELIPTHKALSEISDTLESYNIGIDEGLPKNKAECIVLGKNICTEKPDKQEISFSVGEINKSLLIYPKREWIKQGEKYSISVNDKLESISISYNNAFGGKDYNQNPDGIGYSIDKDNLEIPQIELTNSSGIKPNSNNVIPGSFSVIPMHWQRRSQYYGTINQANPTAIPINVDPKFFQSTPSDQQQKTYFSHGQEFSINGMSTKKKIKGEIPNYIVRIIIKTKSKFIEHKTQFDTLVFFPNEDIGVATFRAKIPIRTFDAKEHHSYVFALDHAESALQRSLEDYQEVLNIKPDENSSDMKRVLLPTYFK